MKGGDMKITVAFSHMEDNSIIRDHFAERALKLQKYIGRFKDDLVYLHGSLDKNPHKEEFYASLCLYLPTKTLHCRETAGDSMSAVSKAYLGLTRQVEKLTDKLTKEKRRQARG
jgi:ribosomal subunit interface protein